MINNKFVNKIIVCILALSLLSSIVFSQSSYIDAENYAHGLGFEIIDSPVEHAYDNGTALIKPMTKKVLKPLNITPLTTKYSDYIVSVKTKEGQEINFLANFVNENNTVVLTLYNKEGGVKIDFTNKVIIDKWSTHNTCNYWTCAGNYILTLFTNPDFILTCGTACSLDITGITCILCVTGFAAEGLIDCLSDKCAWYPCKQDCADQNSYSSYSFYCNSNELWKYRLYYKKCPDGISQGESGQCIYDTSQPVDNSYVKTCSFGCQNGICISETTTTSTTVSTTSTSTTTTLSFEGRISELERRTQELERRIVVFEILIGKYRNIICSIRYFTGFCLPKCPFTCTSTCVNDHNPPVCYNKYIKPEYFCKEGKVCCEKQRTICP